MMDESTQYQNRNSSYNNVQLGTSDPGKLIFLLYSRLERELANAREYIEQCSFELKGDAILLSQEIVLELTNSLNFEAGALAINLQSLYLYIHRELNLANLNNDIESIDTILEILRNLRSSWEEILENNPEATMAAKKQQTKMENMAIVG